MRRVYLWKCNCSECGWDEDDKHPTFPVEASSLDAAKQIASIICHHPVLLATVFPKAVTPVIPTTPWNPEEEFGETYKD